VIQGAPPWPEPWRSTPIFCFFDEPTAGLDPICALPFDDLIKTLRDAIGPDCFLVHPRSGHLYFAPFFFFAPGKKKKTPGKKTPVLSVARADCRYAGKSCRHGQPVDSGIFPPGPFAPDAHVCPRRKRHHQHPFGVPAANGNPEPIHVLMACFTLIAAGRPYSLPSG